MSRREVDRLAKGAPARQGMVDRVTSSPLTAPAARLPQAPVRHCYAGCSAGGAIARAVQRPQPPLNESHASTEPVSSPFMNHETRSSDEPCVKESGTT